MASIGRSVQGLQDRSDEAWLLIVSRDDRRARPPRRARERSSPSGAATQRVRGKLLAEATDEREPTALRRFRGSHRAELPARPRRRRSLPDLPRGVDDPACRTPAQPLRHASGEYLRIHDPATSVARSATRARGAPRRPADAHGEVPHWECPAAGELVFTSCGRCTEVPSPTDDLYGARRTDRRRARREGDAPTRSPAARPGPDGLVRESGCLGCHLLPRQGRRRSGRDLTRTGDKTRHDFDFSHIGRARRGALRCWLMAHFLAPGGGVARVPDAGRSTSAEDAEALTAYMLSLRSAAAGALPRSARRPRPDALSGGGASTPRFCSRATARTGETARCRRSARRPSNNVDTLAVASDDYFAIIENGRSGTNMPAWGAGRGNLTRAADRSHRRLHALLASERGRLSPTSARDAGDAGAARASTGHLRRLPRDRRRGRRRQRAATRDVPRPSPTTVSSPSRSSTAARAPRCRRGSTSRAQAVSDILAYLRSWRAERRRSPRSWRAIDAVPAETERAHRRASLPSALRLLSRCAPARAGSVPR